MCKLFSVIKRLRPSLENIKIIYESENYIVVDKYPDIIINSDDDSRISLAKQLAYIRPSLVDKSIHFGFRFVHRLDHATSGVICIAKNKNAAKKAMAVFENRKTQKYYLALVEGHIRKDAFSIDNSLTRDLDISDYCRMKIVPHSHEKSLSALTRVVCLQHGFYGDRNASKVLLIPFTGRTHQLRVHMNNIGHRIIGDYTYSNREDIKPYRMMLHAYHLKLPVFKEYMDLITDDPFTEEVDTEWKVTESINDQTKIITNDVEKL